MNHVDDSKPPRPKSPALGPANERPSRSKVWEQVFGPPHEENDRIIVERRRPSEHVDTHPADDAAQRRAGKTEQQPSDWHQDERAHEYLAPERGRNDRIAPRPPTETRFDAVYNPTHAKDVTVHLEFDVVSDLDDEVEEFNRLVRQGDFAHAKSFFDDRLVAHSAHPWIFVQYAEMLLEMDELNRQDDIIPVPENMGSTEKLRSEIPTLLALLDIFVSIALDADIDDRTPAFIDKCLRSASAIGDSIMENFPNHVKSRPFLRFILTRSSIVARRSKKSCLDFEYLLGFSGATSFPKHIGLPFYIPVRRENPGWVTSDMPQDSFQPVEMVLNASKEIKDYSTEALCLMELAIRRSNPNSIFDELARYLIARDDDSKAKLLRDLNDLGSWHEPSNLLNPDRACAREIIQQALSPSNHGQQPQKNVHAGVRHYQWLPNYLQEFIDGHVDHPYSKPPRDDPYEETPQTIIIRHGAPPEPHGYNEAKFSAPHSPHRGDTRERQRHPDEDAIPPKVEKVTEQPSGNRNHPIAPLSKALTLRPTIEEGYDSSDDGIDSTA
ncbi:hypothetical protein FALBO_16552 [Fusarium albosuccineum]|uniref:Uncharacterized protein n=1 Tax=Fusarium albosuccineum TaxID=1237068 RepID=A0A8H4KF01_9HYPO|nr:hypothetical protein FALBO_16552 [Fusarium albosuccineum]